MTVDWEKRRERWDDYKQGVKDKAAGREPQKDTKAYLEGFNETRQWKIAKYS